MTLSDLFYALGDSVTETDQRLIDTIAGSPREAAFLSANELARRSGVDPATVVRFARKLGFDGYPALRSRLQSNLLDETHAADRMRSRIAHLGPASLLQQFVEGEVTRLQQLANTLSDDLVMEAARALAPARLVSLFATGHAAALAVLLESRLGRVGYLTQRLDHVPRDLGIKLLQMRKGDAVVLFALGGESPLIADIIAHARRIGARSIVVTDLVGRQLRQQPDVLLAATRGPQDQPRSLGVPMAICNAMLLHLSKLSRSRVIDSLEKLDAIRLKLGPEK